MVLFIQYKEIRLPCFDNRSIGILIICCCYVFLFAGILKPKTATRDQGLKRRTAQSMLYCTQKTKFVIGDHCPVDSVRSLCKQCSFANFVH